MIAVEILARAAEVPVGTVPGIAIVVVVGVVVVALTGLSRSMAAERGTDRRLLRTERRARAQTEQAFRDAIVVRLVELTADADALDSGDDDSKLTADADASVDLTEAEGRAIDLGSSIDLTGEEVGDDDDVRPRAD